MKRLAIIIILMVSYFCNGNPIETATPVSLKMKFTTEISNFTDTVPDSTTTSGLNITAEQFTTTNVATDLNGSSAILITSPTIISSKTIETNGSSIVPVTPAPVTSSDNVTNLTATHEATPSASLKTKETTENSNFTGTFWNATVAPGLNITSEQSSTINGSITTNGSSVNPDIHHNITHSTTSEEEEVVETSKANPHGSPKLESNEFGIVVKILAILFIICFLLCNLGLCCWYMNRRNSHRSLPDYHQSQGIVARRIDQSAPNLLPPSNDRSADEEIQAIEFKHVGPMQIQTKQHSISLIHDLDMDKAPSQTTGDQLVIDPALNEVYEIGSDVELRMDGDQPLKPAEKHPPGHGRDVAIRE